MTEAIWKFPVAIEHFQEIPIPKGGKALAVQTQFNMPHLWVLVDINAPLEIRSFRLLGTGHQHDDLDNLHYIGSFQLDDGEFVGHLFEVLDAG